MQLSVCRLLSQQHEEMEKATRPDAVDSNNSRYSSTAQRRSCHYGNLLSPTRRASRWLGPEVALLARWMIIGAHSATLFLGSTVCAGVCGEGVLRCERVQLWSVYLNAIIWSCHSENHLHRPMFQPISQDHRVIFIHIPKVHIGNPRIPSYLFRSHKHQNRLYLLVLHQNAGSSIEEALAIRPSEKNLLSKVYSPKV